jgi:hypothetical protein
MAYNDIPSVQQALYDVAVNCAARRLDRRCTAEYTSSTCTGCKWNVLEYVDADPRKAKLLLLSAERSAKQLRHTADTVKAFGRGVNALTVVIALIVGVLGVLAVIGLVRQEKERAERLRPKPTTVQTVKPATTDSKVNKALQAVKDNYRDVNGDGLLNCIDAAVLFYQYYPNKNEVTIELNYNISTGLNHLFNVVNFNGTWRAIEPQNGVTRQSSYFMKDVWGSKYDPAYNKDVTREYIKYVRN